MIMVAIKTINRLPENCHCCRFTFEKENSYHSYCFFTHKKILGSCKERMDDCPLIEVEDKELYPTNTIEDNPYENLLKNATSYYNFSRDACKSCPTNPANGGDGICHCILGLQEFRY